jgi:hypothetical protein
MIKREKALKGDDAETARAGTADDSDSGSITTIRTLPKKEETPVKVPAKVEERDYDPASSKVRTVGPGLPAGQRIRHRPRPPGGCRRQLTPSSGQRSSNTRSSSGRRCRQPFTASSGSP